MNGWKKLTPVQRVGFVGGLVGTLVLLVVSAVWFATREDPGTREASRLVARAKVALEDDKPSEALTLLAAAEKLRPLPSAQKLKEQAKAELEARDAFEATRRLLNEGKLAEARERLAKAQPVSDRGAQEKAALGLEIDAKETGSIIAQFHERIAERDLAGAREQLEVLPASARKELSPKLTTLEAELKEEERLAAEREAQQRSARQKQLAAARAAQLEFAFAAVARKFHSGDYERAATECDRVIDAFPHDEEIRTRAKMLQMWIPTFGKNFEDGHRKFKANQLASSVKPLRRARELYRKIGFKGALGEQINEELAAAALAAGREALAVNDLATAALNFREAAALNPTDGRAEEGLERVESLAEQLYQEAVEDKDTDPAVAMRKFRTVLRAAKPGSPLYLKAKIQFNGMQR